MNTLFLHSLDWYKDFYNKYLQLHFFLIKLGTFLPPPPSRRIFESGLPSSQWWDPPAIGRDSVISIQHDQSQHTTHRAPSRDMAASFTRSGLLRGATLSKVVRQLYLTSWQESPSIYIHGLPALLCLWCLRSLDDKFNLGGGECLL